MRTAYVVLVLTMLSAASSYGFDIGISGGIRDWEDTAQRSVRPTPQFVLSFGEQFREYAPFRFDAVGGVWTKREIRRDYFTYMALDDETPGPPPRANYYRQGNDQSEWPGFMLGLRVAVEPLVPRKLDHRIMHPIAGAGLLWIAEESKMFDQRYWRDFVTAEGMLGLVIPVGQTADFLIQFAVAGTHGGSEALSQYLTLGYRFNAFE